MFDLLTLFPFISWNQFIGTVYVDRAVAYCLDIIILLVTIAEVLSNRLKICILVSCNQNNRCIAIILFLIFKNWIKNCDKKK